MLETNIELIPIYIALFFIGACLGSFYFNLAYRILDLYYSQNRKIYKGARRLYELFIHPSHCENCEAKIPAVALIPIIGYFLTRGKCKECGYQIPLIYPIGELLFAISGCLYFYLSDSPWIAVLIILLQGHLLISIYTDITYFSLDYENLIWIFIWGFIANYLINDGFPILEDYYVLAGFIGFFLILYLFYPQGIGFGDVLFAPVFAFLTGHPWWMLFINASYIPAVLFTFIFRDRSKGIRNTPIPMGVYFCLGLLICFIAKLVFMKWGMEIEAYE
ncbi:prepilin peptidase [Leptospira sp. GIMC2001]|uniref:prepilin peptidase n=1 Tax=Leptospira sp. GIMC2001 TaxID=1513297 RepID=UPI00234B6754|nr:A24 family peptidase [Leptospira sp. GIMC2001]WCL48383.1 prepilin peptidase [Leptospira sp. GIMC2001]